MITRLRQRMQGGFTLIELMIVVAIIGILAAVAIPQFMKYIKKSKTVEAVTAVKKMYEGARTYFSEDFTTRTTGAPIARQFPDDQGATPAANACCASGGKCSPNSAQWNDATWTALNFAIDDPHYYWYVFDTSGSNTTSKFTASAYGNLDCDATNSTFDAQATVNADGEVQGTSTVYQEAALE